MNQEIIVSICCTTYNQKDYIAQTIEGFINQKINLNYEILIHDDASTDGTDDIVRAYEKKYPNIIKGIYQKENQYSQGIMTSQIVRERAKGKYIAFCEGDDYWIDENKIQKQVDFLEMYPEYIATSHWCRVVDAEGKENKAFIKGDVIFNFKKDDYTLNDYKKEYIPGHINSIVHRNIFKDKSCNFNEIYKASKLVGDRTTYLILCLLGKIHVHHEMMSAYRYITNNSVSYSSKVKGANQNYDWYLYYSKLEKAINKYMNKDVNLLRLKQQHFLMAIERAIKTKNSSDKEVMMNIWNDSNKMKTIAYFPKNILNRIQLHQR